MKDYRRGRYHVQIEDNGAIKVRAGDWLSKYSAAIHNNFFAIHEYGRMGTTGQVEPVKNPNLINAGETLYHIPTYTAYQTRGGLAKPAVPVPGLSEAEKKRITIEHLKGEFHLQGERLHWFTFAYDKVIHPAEAAAELAEIAGLIAEGGAAATAATALQVVSGVLMPVFIAIEIGNAWESGRRLFGMLAVAYTTTAWAFGDSSPAPSPTILARIKSFYGEQEVPGYRQAWEDSSRATSRKLDEYVANKRVQKKSYQIVLQAVGDGQRKGLCLRILKQFEEEFDQESQRIALRGYYDLEYPH
jgi:hypothetical protein